jgi:hypothetical protein
MPKMLDWRKSHCHLCGKRTLPRDSRIDSGVTGIPGSTSHFTCGRRLGESIELLARGYPCET